MNESPIELRLLRYFAAVAETEHVGRAAQLLHVSQSPLSRQIRQLEDLLGVALFARVGRGISLTPAGRALLPAARDLLARADAFVRDARASTQAAPARLAIGFVGSALSSGVLPAALRALRAAHPYAELALRHAATPAQLEALRAGELDVALVSARPTGLRAHRIFARPFRLAVPRGPLARRPLTRAALAAAAWIIVITGERARERFVAACATAGFTPRIAVEVADFASALALVDAGIGVALVPDQPTATRPANVMLRPMPWSALTSELWVATQLHPSALAAELVERIVRVDRRGRGRA